MKRPPAALLALLVAAPARGETQSYEALGTAPLASGDVVRARGEALGDAMRRALEQAVLQAAPEARGRLYLVLARARDFVPTYRVLEEGTTGGQFQLRIAAQVDLPRLLRELQTTAAPAAPARAVLALCPAEPDAAPLLPPLRETLRGRADIAPCEGDGTGERGPDAKAGPAGAAVLVVHAAADLGRTARVRGTSPPLYGAAARVQIDLASRSGRSEESAEATEFGPDAKEALAAAGRAAAERALQRLGSQLDALLGVPGGGVTVTLDGLDGYAAYQQLLRVLGAMPGVSATEPRRFARSGDEFHAEVLLRTAAAAEPLGAAIGRTPLEGLRLQVVPEGPRRLRLLVVREGALPPSPPADATPPPEAAP